MPAQAGALPQAHLPEALQLSALAPQLTQAPPPIPHELIVGGLTQLPFLQQPEGHDVASQTQPPNAARQCRPTGHWGPALQVQPVPGPPEPPQPLARIASHIMQALPPEPH